MLAGYKPKNSPTPTENTNAAAMASAEMMVGQPATIVVSADTASQLAAGFELLPLGRRVLRGRAEPLEAFKLQIR